MGRPWSIVAGLALGQTEACPELLAQPKRTIVLESLEGVYSVGLFGAKMEIPEESSKGPVAVILRSRKSDVYQ
jgi:hypothetical protein